MKFSVITALSLSALTIAAPIDQAVPEKVAAMADSGDNVTPTPPQYPQWPRPATSWGAPKQGGLGGGKRQSKQMSPFLVAKAAFIGAKLGSLQGTRFTGVKAFWGAKIGAVKGVSKAMRRMRGGRSGGGFMPRPFGGFGGYGGMGGMGGFGRRPGGFGGMGGMGGMGGYGGYGKGYGMRGFGGFRRDQQQDLQGPDDMAGAVAPDQMNQDQDPQYAQDQQGDEGEQGGDDIEAGNDEQDQQAPPPPPPEFRPQEQEAPFDMRNVDAQIRAALAEADVEAPAEPEVPASATPEVVPAAPAPAA